MFISAGGIKGAAHIGAIKALEEENIKFDAISGTSSGSIVGTLFACGYSADDMYEIFKKYSKNIKNIDLKNIVKIIFGLIFKRKIIVNGLNSGKIIEKIADETCSKKGVYNINQVPKELLVPAVDAETRKSIYI